MSLAELERQLWTGGAEAFSRLMDKDAVVVVPMNDGIKDCTSTLEMLAGTAAPDRVVFTHTCETAIGSATAFTYRADAEYDSRTLSVLCTSVWERGRLRVHQQTPVPESEL